MWSALAAGTSCAPADPGEVCVGTTCTAGCYIAGMFYAPNAPNPTNACQSCQPATSITSFTNVSNGTSCPGGDSCCSGTCVPLNTITNCTACGVACDTAESLGAKCVAGTGCTYTGCKTGYGDCNSTAPDANGCETNLTATGQQECALGACYPTSKCCSTAACNTPGDDGNTSPAPESCYTGTCVGGMGGTCSYALNSGDMVCGTSCVQYEIDPNNCGTCNHVCPFNTVDGESSGQESCCSGSCRVHTDGYGDYYGDCTDPTGTPGNAATYNENMAEDACESWTFEVETVGTVICDYTTTCGTSTCLIPKDIDTGTCPDGAQGEPNACVVWCYTGPLAGYTAESTSSGTITCPTTGSRTWD
jgi:hypothetical protein